MAQYEPLEEGVEVNGQTVLAFLNGAPSSFERKTVTILENHGIEYPEPDEWYLQRDWLKAFEEIEQSVGETTVRNIGKSIPENAEWPPDVDSIRGGVESIDDAYHMNHRGGEIGHYTVESKGEEEITIKCTNPYPCVFDQGIIEGVAMEFGARRSSIDEIGDDCRDSGGESCIYKLSW